MSHEKDIESRRRFLKAAAGTAVAAAMIGSLPRVSRAADLPHLADSDPTAKALGYTEDASKVDKTKFPAFKPGAHCATCNFFQGKASDAYAPCQIFPGKAVAAKGWCASHSPKA